MKAVLIAFALASLAAAADNASVAGNWKIHSSIAGNEFDMTCTFTQKEDVVGGKCTSDQQGTLEIAGKVDGKKVTFSYKTEYNGSPLTVNYEGTVDATTGIKGGLDVPEFGVGGEFTAVAAK